MTHPSALRRQFHRRDIGILRILTSAFVTVLLSTGVAFVIVASDSGSAGAAGTQQNRFEELAGQQSNDTPCFSNSEPSPTYGDGAAAGTGTTLCQPSGVVSIPSGSAKGLIIADTHNNRIRFIPTDACSPSSSCPFGGLGGGSNGSPGPYVAGDIYTIAGNGNWSNQNMSTLAAATAVAATSVPLYWPEGLAVDSHGDIAFADTEDGMVRLVANQTCSSACNFGLSSITPGDIYNIAGGYNTFSGVTSVAFDSSDDLIVADQSDAEVDLFAARPCNSSCPFGLASTTVGTPVVIAGASTGIGAPTNGFPIAGEAGTSPDLTHLASVSLAGSGNLIIATDAPGGAMVDVLSTMECPSADIPVCPYQLASMEPGDIYPIAGHVSPGGSLAQAAPAPGLSADILNVTDAVADPAGNIVLSRTASQANSMNDEILVVGEERCTAGVGVDCPYGLAAIVPGDVYQVTSFEFTGYASGTPASQLYTATIPQLAIDAAGDLIICSSSQYEVGEIAGFADTTPPTAQSATYPRAPTTPTGVVAAEGGSNNDVEVSWIAPADDGSSITSYDVTPYDETTSTALPPVAVTGSPPATATTITGLADDTYTFTVTATNSGGAGGTDATSAPSSPSVAVPVTASPSEQWNELNPAPLSVPAGLFNTSMTYDPALGEFVMFGGTQPVIGQWASNTTYAWNGADWVPLSFPSSATLPPARSSAAMAYDPAVGGIVLFGGITGAGTELTDTWIFDGSSWTQQLSAGGPTDDTKVPSMAYDASTSQLVMFGGSAPSNNLSNSTYVWDESEWVQATDATGPNGGNGSAMAYDPADSSLVLIDGGGTVATWAGAAYTWSDTTLIDGTPEVSAATWVPIPTPQGESAPTARENATLAYDPTAQDLLFTGGHNQSFGNDVDSWTLNPGGSTVWDETSTTGTTYKTPSYTDMGAAASGPTEILRYGGRLDTGGNVTSATWAYGDPPPPATISDPVAMAGMPYEVALSWQAPLDPGQSIAGYKIENNNQAAGTAGGGDGVAVEFNPISISSAYSYTFAPIYEPTGVWAGESYAQPDSTYDTVGPYSAPAAFDSSWSPPYPAAPTAVTATPGVSMATVSWTVPPDDGWTITGFHIIPTVNSQALQTVTEGAGVVGSTLDPTPGSTDSTTLSLPTSGSYTFKVQAIDDYEASGQSVGPYSAPSSAINVSSTVTPDLSITPTTYNFASTVDGQTSALEPIVVKNNTDATAELLVTAVTIGGNDPSDFAITANGCVSGGGDLPAGQSCTVDVEFTPPFGTTSASYSANLSVTDNATGTPQSVALGGSGTPAYGSPSLSTSSYTYPDTDNGQVSADETFTLMNLASATNPLVVSNVELGGTDPSDFSILSDDCTGESLAASVSCDVDVVFTPPAGTSPTTATATLVFYDNVPQSAESVVLTGSGTPPLVGTPSVTPAAITFGAVTSAATTAPEQVVLTNPADATSVLNVSGASITGNDAADFAVASDGCSGTTLTIGGSGGTCTVGVTFTPAAVGGSFAAELVFADDGTGSPQVVPLSGTYHAPSSIALSSQSIAFGAQFIDTTSAATTLTVENSSDAPIPVTIASTRIPESNSPFAVTADTCAGATLAQGAACSVAIDFDPQAVAVYFGSLVLTDGATGSPQTIELSGSGVSSEPDVTPTSLQFGPVLVGASTEQFVTVSNESSATAPLSLGAASVSGGSAFSLNADGCSGATIAPGGSCALGVSFAPTTTGPEKGSVRLAGLPGSDVVAIGGTGVTTAPPIALASGTVFATDFTGAVTEIPPAGGTPSTVGTGLNLPAGLAFDAKSVLYVADEGNNRIVKLPLGATSAPQSTIGGGLADPLGLAIDPAGNAYVADTAANELIEFSASGSQVVLANALVHPGGVAVDGAGNVFVANTGDGDVIEINGGTHRSSIVTEGLSTPTAVAVDASGNLYIAEMTANVVEEISTRGAVTTVGSGLVSPDALAIDASGNLYIADENGVVEVRPNHVQSPLGGGLDTPVGVAVYPPAVPGTRPNVATVTKGTLPLIPKITVVPVTKATIPKANKTTLAPVTKVTIPPVTKVTLAPVTTIVPPITKVTIPATTKITIPPVTKTIRA